jgi:hypothetical protein
MERSKRNQSALFTPKRPTYVPGCKAMLTKPEPMAVRRCEHTE